MAYRTIYYRVPGQDLMHNIIVYHGQEVGDVLYSLLVHRGFIVGANPEQPNECVLSRQKVLMTVRWNQTLYKQYIDFNTVNYDELFPTHVGVKQANKPAWHDSMRAALQESRAKQAAVQKEVQQQTNDIIIEVPRGTKVLIKYI